MKVNIYYLSPIRISTGGQPLPVVEVATQDIWSPEGVPVEDAFTAAIRSIREAGIRPTPTSWVSPSAIIRIEVAE